jgi:hypothetical protein
MLVKMTRFYNIVYLLFAGSRFSGATISNAYTQMFCSCKERCTNTADCGSVSWNLDTMGIKLHAVADASGVSQ